MAAVVLTILFVSAGIFAVASLRDSWRRYGAAALAIRGELRDYNEWREVRVTVREITVHPAGAVVLRPDFKARARPRAPEHALPAAA